MEHMHKKEMAHAHDTHVSDFTKRLLVSGILTIPVVVAALVPFTGSLFVQLILSTIILIYGGAPFFRGFMNEMTVRTPGMMTLISLALIVAYGYSLVVVFIGQGMPFFSELVTLIDVMLLGHYLEMKSLLGASAAVKTLTSLLPDIAHVIVASGITDMPIDHVQKGMKLLVRPGEKLPADGIIIQGESELHEAALTGESAPVYKAVGNEVIAGSINGNGSLTIEVTKDAHENYIAQVIKTVSDVMQSKSSAQDLADKIAQLLTYAALGMGLTGILFSAMKGFSFAHGLERFVTVMVTACPHALGLAIPLVIVVISGRAAREGLLIRNRKAFEKAAEVSLVVFDKTGTFS